jgi:hypothetical protein
MNAAGPEPDREQIERFVRFAFAEAPDGSFVALRSFYDDRPAGNEPPFASKYVRLNGNGLGVLVDEAHRMALAAAQCSRPVNFCPSLATYTKPGTAKAADLAAGLTLTVECDERAEAAKRTLSAIIGPPTMTVASGGEWTDPETGEIQPKLHLHWTLRAAAVTLDDQRALRRIRALSCDLVGADGTSKATVHPIRWPGTVHRKDKASPRLCRIVEVSENRLDLHEALAELEGLEALRDSVEAEDRRDSANGAAGRPLANTLLAGCAARIPNNGVDWAEWNRLAMAFWRASEGSDDGFAAFDAWSAKSAKHDPVSTKGRWQHFSTSPPDKIGVGTLVYLARQADANFMCRRPEPREHGQPRVVSEEEQALAPFYAAVAELNERYFVVDLGGAVTIATFHRDQERGRDRLVLLKRGDFTLKFGARHYLVGWNKQTEKEIWKPLGEAWLENPRRRSFDQVTMSTDRNLPPDTLNLWRNYGCEANPGGWPTIGDHLRTIICKGNERDFKYLEGLLARWVQRPVSCGEVAFVMRGKKGAGKGAVAHLMCRIFKHHAMTTANARDILGNFNAHLMDLCLLFLDEAFWAGDKQAEGRLQALITEPDQRIEPKGVNVFSVPNRLKIIMATNNDWVVPASGDERRYFVVNVSDAKLDDTEYFNKLFAAIDGAEAEAFLYHLLNLDLTSFNHRAVPHTDALNEQKLISGDSVQKWWASCLYAGSILGHETLTTWPYSPVLKPDLHAAYVAHCMDHGDRYPLIINLFAQRLYELAPSTKIKRAPADHDPQRRRCFALQSLEKCRADFQTVMRINVHDWDDGDEKT